MKFPEGLQPRKLYERRDDMSEDGKLVVTIQEDGDVIVGVIQPSDEKARGWDSSVEFCASGGGGRSQRVRDALLNLAVAIKEDNEERPIE